MRTGVGHSGPHRALGLHRIGIWGKRRCSHKHGAGRHWCRGHRAGWLVVAATITAFSVAAAATVCRPASWPQRRHWPASTTEIDSYRVLLGGCISNRPGSRKRSGTPPVAAFDQEQAPRRHRAEDIRGYPRARIPWHIHDHGSHVCGTQSPFMPDLLFATWSGRVGVMNGASSTCMGVADTAATGAPLVPQQLGEGPLVPQQPSGSPMLPRPLAQGMAPAPQI